MGAVDGWLVTHKQHWAFYEAYLNPTSCTVV